MNSKYKCYLCGSIDKLKNILLLEKRPEGEPDYAIDPREYRRYIRLCLNCGVYNNFHGHSFAKMYSGRYRDVAYKEGIIKRYESILNLPFEESINKQRIKRIIDFCDSNSMDLKKSSVLDVGSGSCVFLGEFLKHGIKGYCVEPDATLIDHAISYVKVNGGFSGSFMDYRSDIKFDIITFNKVLEHVKDPVMFLSNAKKHLKKDGFIYIELPDGGSAAENSSIDNREEFYIDHYTVFTEKATDYFIEKCGFDVIKREKIHEPGDRYSLYAFCGL